MGRNVRMIDSLGPSGVRFRLKLRVELVGVTLSPSGHSMPEKMMFCSFTVFEVNARLLLFGGTVMN